MKLVGLRIVRAGKVQTPSRLALGGRGCLRSGAATIIRWSAWFKPTSP